MCRQHDLKGNPVRGPLNALFFTAFDSDINRRLAAPKSKLFRNLPSAVVELGAGVGANFGYFEAGTHVTAIEPNPHMHRRLRRKARACAIELDIVHDCAETIPLPDHSVEAVICTLVLCTVDDPARTLQQVRRILKPGGRFLFLEHVAAAQGHWRRRLQNAVHRPWRYVFEGCNTNRDTGAVIRSAGFRHVTMETYTMSGPFVPVNTQIAGVASA
ncbi:MAG: class I SAM-dependent methyltransferase [Gammaproteobacteria bacterium]